MIFPVWTLQSVHDPFGIEYDQTVIIRFLWNEGAYARQIADGFQAKFAEHSYELRTVRFWIAEIRRGRQDLHNEIRSGRPPLDDLDNKILEILEKSPFESFHSIAERLLVAQSTILRHLHESVGFKSFHLHWVPHLLSGDFSKNERSMQKIYCHSFMPPNVMTGIIFDW
jgi:transposase